MEPLAEIDEAAEIYREFIKLLVGPTEDGQIKRAAGEKPSWKVDDGHLAALLRHLFRYLNGETVDPDSGCHPMQHVEWRAGAIAWQELHEV